jgi:signal transduction histidine kinase
MGKNTFSPTDSLFRKLLFKLISFHVLSLFVFVALAVAIVNNSKTHQAKQFSDAFRDLLISGDTSQVMVSMSKPILNDFIGVYWNSARGTQNFSIPLDLKKPSPYLYRNVSIPVYFDEERTIEAGRMLFYYPRGVLLGWAVAAWGFLVLISIPISLAEKKRIIKDWNILVLSNINESKALMAAQVAHDIRSPVFALNAALKNIPQLPERQRAIVRHAVNRIQDVANSLLEKNRQQSATAAAAGIVTTGEFPAVYLLSALIDPVVTEKRLQYEARPEVKIDFVLSRESYGLFANVQPVEFRRMVSNLLNNAVEALGAKGTANVGLAIKDEAIVLTVTDAGKGISPEILAKLGQRGETHGKTGGSGLGLYHARTTSENWGGSLTITSELGKGTTVAIKLPKAETPSYFARELKLVPGRPVLVLDDDPGIHEMWRGRFESNRVKEHKIEVFYFTEPGKLRDWVKGEPTKAGKALCLFDYELTGYKETGLSMAEELGLCSQTILVTSHSEEQPLIAACAALKVRMIPKGLADLVSVSIVSHPPRAVLLDDSTITQMTWEIAAEEAGVELLSYAAPDKFMADLDTFPKDMPIYIDSELGEDIKGEKIAEDLKGKGFTNICLATAHPPEKFAHLPWLKVRSKEAPWVNSADSVTGE